MTGRKTYRRRAKGFARTSSLLQAQIREVGASRGFAVTRLITHWDEIAGQDIAGVARPVDVKYGRGGGLGATLTLLTTGANAPMLDMRREEIRARVNACYGYAAISRVRITQTAPKGFSDGQVQFAGAPRPADPAPVNPQTHARAEAAAGHVCDSNLRDALVRLGENVLSRSGN